MTDSDFEFSAAMELSSDIFAEDSDEDVYRDPKCDFCNCALRDCSLCGSDGE